MKQCCADADLWEMAYHDQADVAFEEALRRGSWDLVAYAANALLCSGGYSAETRARARAFLDTPVKERDCFPQLPKNPPVVAATTGDPTLDRRYLNEQLAELRKVPSDLMALIRHQALDEARRLHAEADALQSASDHTLAQRGVTLHLDEARMTWPEVIKKCAGPIDVATAEHGGSIVHLHYHPSKQTWAWKVHRGTWEWFISTDDLAKAFAPPVAPLLGKRAILQDIHCRPKEIGWCRIIAASTKGPTHVVVEWEENQPYRAAGDVSCIPIAWLEVRE